MIKIAYRKICFSDLFSDPKGLEKPFWRVGLASKTRAQKKIYFIIPFWNAEKHEALEIQGRGT